jgi:hypothetical protein
VISLVDLSISCIARVQETSIAKKSKTDSTTANPGAIQQLVSSAVCFHCLGMLAKVERDRDRERQCSGVER